MSRDCSGKGQRLIIDALSPTLTDEVVSGNDAAQREVCPLCLRPDLLEQDHDHRTDLCRGRICHACNVHLGRFDRPVEEIQRFIDYLSYWERRHVHPDKHQTYTEYMREAVPGYRLGRRAPRRRKTVAA